MSKTAYDFSFKSIDGKPLPLSEFKGKTVVLEWVNEGCPYVRKHYGAGSMQATQGIAKADGVPTYEAADRLAERRLKAVASLVKTWPQWPNR